MVFYSKMQEYSENTDLSKEEAFLAAKYDAIFVVKLIAIVHSLIFILFLFFG